MAIIVDKVQKRKDIALSCRDLFADKGFNNITIAQIAKTAGVGKGTVYEYFSNKDEIVFELVTILMQKHSAQLEESLLSVERMRDKVKKFSEFFYDEEHAELRSLYKEFVSLSLLAPKEEIVAFQTECFNNYYNWFEKLFKESVAQGELLEEALGLVKGIFVTGEGMFITSCTTNRIVELENDFTIYIDNLFNIIEVKK